LFELFSACLVDQCARGEFGHIFVFAHRDSLNEIFEIVIGFEFMVTAVLYDGVEHRAAPSRFFRFDEEEVLFSYRSWPDCVFDEVVVNLHQSVFKVDGQARPLPEGVGDGLTE